MLRSLFSDFKDNDEWCAFINWATGSLFKFFWLLFNKQDEEIDEEEDVDDDDEEENWFKLVDADDDDIDDDGDDDDTGDLFIILWSFFLSAFSLFCLRHLARLFLNHTLNIK